MNKPEKMRHIFVIEDTDGFRSIYLEKPNYSLGRHSSNTIMLNSRLVSRNHASLLRVKYTENQDQDLYWIIDGDLNGNRSTNGIEVNGKKCLSHELKSGDVVVLGGEVKGIYYKTNNLSGAFDVDDNEPDGEGEEATTGLIQQEVTGLHKKTIDYPLNKSDNQLILGILSKLNSLPEFLPHCVIEINSSGEITYVNEVALYKFPEIKLLKIRHPLLDGLWNYTSLNQENLIVRELKIGQEIYEQYIHYLKESNVIRTYVFDLTKRKQIEIALKESEERYRAVVRQISEGIILVEPKTKQILECNAAYCQLLGYSLEEMLGLKLYDVIALEKENIDKHISQIINNKMDFVIESLHTTKQESLVSVEMNISLICYGEKEVLCFAVRDITARKRTEEMLKYQASHDLLTGLPNRTLFNERLHHAIAKAKKNQQMLAVMFLDLDHFKKINDTLGHATGDMLLKNFAKRVLNCLRGSDTVARWGGDEFTILLSPVTNEKDVAQIGERIIESIKNSFDIEGNHLHVGVSIGIAIYPQDGEDGETLLKNADAILYRAKDQGRNHYRFYNPMVNAQASGLLKLENLLHQALEKQQFRLHYQPKVNTETLEIVGMEALIRWQHPEQGQISPQKFIPLAEESGLIVPIGQWVLYNACRQNKAWQLAGFPPFQVAVNISPRQFQQGKLVSTIKRVLELTQLDPQFLELEITENIIINNVDFAQEALTQLSRLGVNIAIDDFGTGYSSLAYLKKFPFHTLKIDQSFVRELKNKPEDKAIISAIITLGRGLGLKVVAEGVETEEQLKLLRELKCQEIQGYWFSKPLEVDRATKLLNRSTPTLPNSEPSNLNSISLRGDSQAKKVLGWN